jgi:hypothetical protein
MAWQAGLSAQTDSLPPSADTSKPGKIASVRKDLLQSFLMEDPAGAALWMDSLARLEDEQYVGLVWDERWLLYFWTESYGTLLEEVSRFNETQRALLSWKIQPPDDSLFFWIDETMRTRQFEVYGHIRNAFLNEEEKVLSILLFEYLLRLNSDEEAWEERLQSFEDHYPQSRYRNFIAGIKPHILKPTNKAIGISGGLQIGNFNGTLDRTLETPYAFNMDVYYWTDRWNILFDMAFGGPKLARDVTVSGETWPREDPTTFMSLNLLFGYDFINARKIRIFPAIGGGLGIIKPPTPGEDEDPLPEYYENFHFYAFHLSAGLNIDLKLFQKNYRNWDTPKGSYHGVRLKLGWNRLNFAGQSQALQGEMFYFAVNYNLFAFLSKK